MGSGETFDSRKKILLVGGGGHCRAVMEVLSQTEFTPGAIIDADNSLTSLLGVPVVGNDSMLKSLRTDYEFALVSVGQIKNYSTRWRLYKQLKSFGYILPVLCSPRACVSSWAHVGEGSVIMHSSAINACACIGVNCIINTGAIIEHDVKVGDNCHISTGAIVNGGTEVGSNSFIGSGAAIRENVKIGQGSIIAMGSKVYKNIPDNTLYIDDEFKPLSLAN